MKVEQIEFEGLKGRSNKLALDPLTYVTGRNRGGKSSVKDALILAITGNHPDLPKTNAGTMALAAGGILSVAARFAGGDSIARTWSMSKAGRITAKASGNAPEYDLNQFDPRQFLALGPKQRLAYLSAQADQTALSETLREALVEYSALVDLLDDSDDPFEGIEAISSEIVNQRRAAKQDKDRLSKAIKEHVATMPNLSDDDAERGSAEALNAAAVAVATITAEISATRKARAEAIERLADIEHWDKENAAAPFPLTDEEFMELTKLERAGMAAAEDAEFRAALRQTIEEYDGKIADQDELDSIAETLKGAAIETGDSGPRAEFAYFDETTAKGVLTEQQAARSEARARLHYAKAELLNIQRQEFPHTCGACGQSIDQALARFQHSEKEAKQIAEIAEVEKEIEVIETGAKLAAAAIEEIQSKNAKIAEQEKAFKRLRKHENARATIDMAQRELDKTAPPLTAEQRERQAELRKQEAESKRARADRPEPLGNPEELAETLEGLKQRREIAEQELETVREINGRVRKREQWEETKTRLESDLEAATEETERVAAMEKSFESAKSETLKNVWRSVISIVSRILQETFEDFTISADFDGTDLGLRDGAGFRKFETLSGSEATATAFALAVAAATRQPLKLAIIDELGHFDADSKPRFLRAVAGLVSDNTLAQAIVFHHDGAAEAEAAGFRVIEASN